MKKKICFFTSHSPLIGGGGTNFRSLIENLPELSVLWTYVASEEAPGYEQGYLGHGHMGGNLIVDVWQTWRMLSGGTCPTVNRIVDKLLAIDCDSYWIASHNEGIRVALELAQIQQSRPVHMTVHDDWAGAICARSLRYSLLANLARDLTTQTLHKVHTFDVISKGMQAYYQQLTGRQGEISHRFIPADRIGVFDNSDKIDTSAEIVVGHLGSIYDKKTFIDFLTLLKEFSLLSGREVIIRTWGSYQNKTDIPVAFRDIVQVNPGMAEEVVITELARCHFVYAMYPLEPSLSLFSKTSMPAKVSSYVMAGRPIFGHAPPDSSLAEFLHTTGTGVLWNDQGTSSGIKAIKDILALQPSPEQWRIARDDYFGDKNLASMRKVLLTPLREQI